MIETLIKVVTQMGSPTILVVGDFMLDVYIFGDATRISPEAPVPVLKVRDTHYSCGGASSVVADIASLEAHPICLGLIGDDDNGRRLRTLFSDMNVDTTGLLMTAERPTITKKRLIGLAQHRHQQQLFRMDEECTDPFSTEICNRLIDVYRDKLKCVDVVCLQDYNKGLLHDALCRTFISLAKKEGKSILVDPANISHYSKYEGATLLTPNRQETSEAVGFDLNSEVDIASAAEKLLTQLDLEAIVITLDKQGAYLKTKHSEQLVPTRPRRVYDVTGAGDMVLAMLATAVAGGCDFLTAVQLSNVAGGIEVEKFGVATVTREEILTELMGRNQYTAQKIYSQEALLTQLARHRNQEQSIVFTNGCFDLLHRGHIEYLQFCKTQGDVVVVGLNSDQSVHTLKGPDRPIQSEDDRATILAALAAVDYVTVFNEPEPYELIKMIQPDILIKGDDWKDKGVIGSDIVEAAGGKVLFAPLVKGRSSSMLINQMKDQGGIIG